MGEGLYQVCLNVVRFMKARITFLCVIKAFLNLTTFKRAPRVV